MVVNRTVTTGQTGQDRQDRAPGTGQQRYERTNRRGWSEHDRKDRTPSAGALGTRMLGQDLGQNAQPDRIA